MCLKLSHMMKFGANCLVNSFARLYHRHAALFCGRLFAPKQPGAFRDSGKRHFSIPSSLLPDDLIPIMKVPVCTIHGQNLKLAQAQME